MKRSDMTQTRRLEQDWDILNRGKHDAIHQAGAKDGAVLQEVVREQTDSREPLLPNGEKGQTDHTEDDEADDCRACPAMRGVADETERQQKHGPTAGSQKQANDCNKTIRVYPYLIVLETYCRIR